MKARRFLFVGGGTGGHLAPALGLAEELRARGHDTLFLTSGRAVEQGFLEAAGESKALGVDGGSLPPKLALFPAMARARRMARTFRPDLVVGMGGLCSCAALVARRGRPLVLLEGNRVVGRAVRLLSPWARQVFTLFRGTAEDLERGEWVGPIGRRALAPMDPAAARRALGLDPVAPVLLVTGGSQGAEALNRCAAEMAEELASRGIQLLALSGPGKAEPLRRSAEQAGLRAVVLEHCSEMGQAYSAADFALCRGGAATVAELWLHRLPAAVIPYPHHRDRQQEVNARALGEGVILLEQPLDRAARAALLECLDDPMRRLRMRELLERSAPPDGLSRAATLLEESAAAQP